MLPIVLAAGLPAAQAGGGEEPTIRRITPTEADSDCIGDPRTPLCAVETRMACFIRKDVSLCRQVGDHESVYGDDSHYARFDVESRYCEYTIDSAFYVVYEVFELNGIDLKASVGTIDWRRAGIYEIYTHERSCPLDDEPCRQAWLGCVYKVDWWESRWRVSRGCFHDQPNWGE